MIPNPWVILGAVLFLLASVGGSSWLAYDRGRDDMKSAYTVQQLASANQTIKELNTNQAKAASAGADHEVKVQTVHDTTREIVRTVQLPPDADPFLPVGFVRVVDRAASRNSGADPYPGKSDGDPSDVRVSEAMGLFDKLGGWADDYYTCRQQVIDIISLKPVLPAPTPPPAPTLLDRLNPFS